jgi:Na+/proline symporter
MILSSLDLVIIVSFFLLSIGIGLYASKKSGKNTANFFLSGRNMPWWLLGISMVATTFAADTPGLVAGIVRADGVAGNWVWWSFLLTGMLTVFFYAKLWRKSNITTDLEFYELRYSGKSAAFLRGFRAIYLGVFFNIVIMATVCLAAIKIGHVMFGFSAFETLSIAAVVTVIYSGLGGLRGVVLTDFVQFIIAMAGSVWACIYLVNLPEIGGLDALIATAEVASKTSIFPDFSNPEVYVPLFLVPLAVQWWSVWYPGAEPGGGGYIVQRMLAAKNESHAVKASFFFTITHYAIRPWPWILIGLASIVVYPNIASLATAFPYLESHYIKDDLSYAAMLQFLPKGLLGLVITSLIAAFMSTISTHLNWGSSYVVNDFYARFVRPSASEKQKVRVGRITTVVLMIFASILALVLEEAKEAFDLLLQIGAGTGLLFILRWFWMKINPYSEISAMLSSFIIALVFFVHDKLDWGLWQLLSYEKLIIGVLLTTVIWVVTSLLTKPSERQTLKNFKMIIFDDHHPWKNIKYQIIAFLAGVGCVYSLLFLIGNILYKEVNLIILCSIIFGSCSIILIKYWKKVS